MNEEQSSPAQLRNEAKAALRDAEKAYGKVQNALNGLRNGKAKGSGQSEALVRAEAVSQQASFALSAARSQYQFVCASTPPQKRKRERRNWVSKPDSSEEENQNGDNMG